MRFLLDTHAAIWAAEDDARLGNGARTELERVEPGEAVVADISLLEIAMLAWKGRIGLDGETVDYLEALAAIYPPLRAGPGIAGIAFDLRLPNADPFDRVIVATALHHNLPLLTRDRAIRRSGIVATVW